MTDVWNATAAVGGVVAAVAAVGAWVASRRTNTTSAKALELQQATEHERSAPRLDVIFREVVGGGGLRCMLSVDRAVDSLTVELVRGVDEAADNSILGLTEGLAPGPVGTLGAVLEVAEIPAGSARTLTLWTSDLDRAANSTVRLRSRARRGDRTWADLLNDVTVPAGVGSKTSS